MQKYNGEGGLVVLGGDGIGVASAFSDDRPECLANARLIAAAPELLTCLDGLLTILKGHAAEANRVSLTKGGAGLYDLAEAIIDKAKGEPR
jgi:hypothetical protein